MQILAILFVALWSMVTPGPLLAQGARSKETSIKPSTESQVALIRRTFENELRLTLDKFLKPHQYAIDLSFTAPPSLTSKSDVPYAPDSVVSDSYQGAPTPELLKQLKDLKVQILVPQWMDNQTKTTLQNLLGRRLESLVGNPVPVELQSVALDVEQPQKPVQSIVQNQGGSAASGPNPELQRSLRELDELKATMSKEREQFRQELQDLQKKLNEREQAASAQAAQAAQGPAGAPSQNNIFQNFWEFLKSNPVGAAIVLLLTYGGIFLLAFLPSRSVASGMGSIQSAFGGIAKSIHGVGESLGRSGSGSADGGGSRSHAHEAHGDVGAAPMLGVGGSGGGSSGGASSQQPSYPEIREMLGHIQKNHQASADPLVIEMLSGYFSLEGQGLKALLTLEMLGRPNAHRIFEQLTEDKKELVLREVNRPALDMRDKSEALYEVAEAYQTRLLAAGWRGGKHSSLDETIKRDISGLKVDDHFTIARQLKGEEALRRFLLYLDPPSLVRIVQGFKRTPEERNLVMKALAGMPEALDDGHVDREIQHAVRRYLTRKREDRYLPYLKHFETIIMQSGEDMEDELIEQITRSNPGVGRILRAKIVTIGSFFALGEADRKELLTPFSNRDLASLLGAFSDEEKRKAILGSIEARRRELVQEQMAMQADENKFTLLDMQAGAKARLKDATRRHLEAQGSNRFEADEATDEHGDEGDGQVVQQTTAA